MTDYRLSKAQVLRLAIDAGERVFRQAWDELRPDADDVLELARLIEPSGTPVEVAARADRMLRLWMSEHIPPGHG